MAKGVLYIMECVSLPGLIKIGKTETKQYESRMYTLEKDGYRHMVLKRAFAIEVDDYDQKEKMLHKVFERAQVADTELFAVDTKLAISLLDSFEGNEIYPNTVQSNSNTTNTIPVKSNKSSKRSKTNWTSIWTTFNTLLSTLNVSLPKKTSGFNRSYYTITIPKSNMIFWIAKNKDNSRIAVTTHNINVYNKLKSDLTQINNDLSFHVILRDRPLQGSGAIAYELYYDCTELDTCTNIELEQIIKYANEMYEYFIEYAKGL